MFNSHKQNIKKVLNSNALSKVTLGEKYTYIYQVLNLIKGFSMYMTKHTSASRKAQNANTAILGIIPLIFLLLSKCPL